MNHLCSVLREVFTCLHRHNFLILKSSMESHEALEGPSPNGPFRPFHFLLRIFCIMLVFSLLPVITKTSSGFRGTHIADGGNLCMGILILNGFAQDDIVFLQNPKLIMFSLHLTNSVYWSFGGHTRMFWALLGALGLLLLFSAIKVYFAFGNNNNRYLLSNPNGLTLKDIQFLKGCFICFVALHIRMDMEDVIASNNLIYWILFAHVVFVRMLFIILILYYPATVTEDDYEFEMD